MQVARPPPGGAGRTGTPRTPLVTTPRLADSTPKDRLLHLEGYRAVVTKRVCASSCGGVRRRADVGIRTSLRKMVQERLG